MRRRFVTITSTALFALLACAPFAFADEGGNDDTHNLAIFLAVCVVIASAVVMELTNRHFKRKREENARKNRQRSKKKKRK